MARSVKYADPVSFPLRMERELRESAKALGARRNADLTQVINDLIREEVARERVALDWSAGKIGSGKAAERLGMTRRLFLEWAARNRIEWPYTSEMLADDLKFAKEGLPDK
jgi:predicted HTH domain antitoxin